MDDFYEECVIYVESLGCHLLMLDRLLMILTVRDSNKQIVKLNVPKELVNKYIVN